MVLHTATYANATGYRREATGTSPFASGGGEAGVSYVGCFTLKIARIVRVTARSERLDASWMVSSCASGSLRSRLSSGMICRRFDNQNREDNERVWSTRLGLRTAGETAICAATDDGHWPVLPRHVCERHLDAMSRPKETQHRLLYTPTQQKTKTRMIWHSATSVRSNGCG